MLHLRKLQGQSDADKPQVCISTCRRDLYSTHCSIYYTTKAQPEGEGECIIYIHTQWMAQNLYSVHSQ